MLLVDDDPMVTSLVGALLVAEGFTVESCAEASTARRLVGQFDPDLVILEVNLGGKPTGLQLGHVLARLHPEIALLYFTRYPTALLTDPAMAEHVRCQTTLAKSDMHDSAILLRTIDDAFRGKGAPVADPAGADAAVGQLTTTQLEILALVAEGLTNAAIAEQRETSELAHPPAIAEACMLREFMRPERRRMRTITFEQLRLSIDDPVLQRAIADALRQRADEIAAEAPGRSVEDVRVSITLENGLSTGLALLAQLRPDVWSLPYDVILMPWRAEA